MYMDAIKQIIIPPKTGEEIPIEIDCALVSDSLLFHSGFFFKVVQIKKVENPGRKLVTYQIPLIEGGRFDNVPLNYTFPKYKSALYTFGIRVFCKLLVDNFQARYASKTRLCFDKNEILIVPTVVPTVVPTAEDRSNERMNDKVKKMRFTHEAIDRMKLTYEMWRMAEFDIRVSYTVSSNLTMEYLWEHCKEICIKILLLMKKSKFKLKEVEKGTEIEENRETLLEYLRNHLTKPFARYHPTRSSII